MAARSAAQQWLDAHQRATYQKLGLTPARVAELAREAQEQVGGAEGVDLAAVPGPFESPLFFTIMRARALAIEEIIGLLDIPLPKRPVFGTLPTGKVNASVWKVTPDGETAIIFDAGLFVFTLLVAKALALAMPARRNADGTMSFSINRQAVEAHLQANPEAIQRLLDAVRAYVVLANPGKAERYRMPSTFNQLLDVEIRAIELFAVGHEYAHITRGHLDHPAAVGHHLVHDTGDARQAADEIIYAHQQELEADAWGLKFARLALSKHKVDLANALSGPTIFFCAIAIAERAIGLLETGDEATRPADTSHPPPELRLHVMREGIRSALGAEADGPLDLSGNEEWILNLLWQRSRDNFSDLRAAGVKPNDIWRRRLVA